jgi:hypothetical protein
MRFSRIQQPLPSQRSNVIPEQPVDLCQAGVGTPDPWTVAVAHISGQPTTPQEAGTRLAKPRMQLFAFRSRKNIALHGAAL